jgi:hypothetical protein
MFPAIAAAGANLIGGLGSAFMSYNAQKKTNQMNYNIAKEQMKFQERMSNTAYQRGMEDMKKAGLNPMLAYGQGGATSPPGASAKMESPMKDSAPLIANAVSSAVNTGMQIYKGVKETDLLEKQIGLTKAKTKTEGYIQKEKGAHAKKMNAETILTKIKSENERQIFTKLARENDVGKIAALLRKKELTLRTKMYYFDYAYEKLLPLVQAGIAGGAFFGLKSVLGGTVETMKRSKLTGRGKGLLKKLQLMLKRMKNKKIPKKRRITINAGKK